jgi:hypothetical protein
MSFLLTADRGHGFESMTEQRPDNGTHANAPGFRTVWMSGTKPLSIHPEK